MYRKAQGTPANKIAKSCQINRRQLSWIWARIVRKNSLSIVETNQQSFFSKNRLQNSWFFFSKSIKNSAKRGVRDLSPQVSLSVFSLVPELLFDCSRVLEYGKIRTCCSLFEKWKPNQLIWMPNKITAGINGFRSLIFDCNNFLQREPKRQLYFVMAR